jgi:hypothetical protein
MCARHAVAVLCQAANQAFAAANASTTFPECGTEPQSREYRDAKVPPTLVVKASVAAAVPTAIT